MYVYNMHLIISYTFYVILYARDTRDDCSNRIIIEYFPSYTAAVLLYWSRVSKLYIIRHVYTLYNNM